MRVALTSAFLLAAVPIPAIADDQVATAQFNDGTRTLCLFVVRTQSPVSWSDAASKAKAANSILLAPSSSAMSNALATLAETLGPWECVGPWLGVMRRGATSAIADDWLDPLHEPVSYTNWTAGEPSGAPALRWGAAFDGRSGSLSGWVNLLPDPDAGPDVFGYAFSTPAGFADCDDDGIPDLLEIEILNAPDVDGDGIPDTCIGERADLNNDGIIDGADLGMFLLLWGECPTDAPCSADLNVDGRVDGNDLGIFLAQWTG